MPLPVTALLAKHRPEMSPLLPLPAYDSGVLLQGQGASSVLQVALSDGEYQIASALPDELRTSLYPELLTYGPAYEDIQHFYSRMVATNTLEEARFTKEGVRSLGTGGAQKRTANIISWIRGEGQIDLSNRFADLALECAADRSIVNWDREFTRGFIYLCWLLTGQYIFSAEFIQETQPDWALANTALERLSLPPLTGRLSDEER